MSMVRCLESEIFYYYSVDSIHILWAGCLRPGLRTSSLLFFIGSLTRLFLALFVLFLFFDLIFSFALDHTDLSFPIWPLTPVCLSNHSIAFSPPLPRLPLFVFPASLGSAHHSTVSAHRRPRWFLRLCSAYVFLVNPWRAPIQRPRA